jgi:hypothetical protein
MVLPGQARKDHDQHGGIVASRLQLSSVITHSARGDLGRGKMALPGKVSKDHDQHGGMPTATGQCYHSGRGR